MSGEFYVYCWYYLDTKQIFYVGKGSGNRYLETKGRSALFQRMLELYPCGSRLLRAGLSEEKAIAAELELIRSYVEKRHPLINIKDGEYNPAQREGIDAAKKRGKYLGRPRVELPGHWKRITDQWQAGQMTAVEAMRRLEMSRATFYRLARREGIAPPGQRRG